MPSSNPTRPEPGSVCLTPDEVAALAQLLVRAGAALAADAPDAARAVAEAREWLQDRQFEQVRP
ncbi:MAG TPA: hypothetical protein VG276_31490, partial [Actinomycetes bacterium]|nr:hypothetical protein [Actinomycetes bacterium]